MVTIGICDDELDVRDAIRESVIESMKEESTEYELREYDRTTEILFVTSIENKISEAFEVRAFRFIKKPVQHEVIEKNIEEL